MKKHIYILSGLGTDERVFVNIDLSEFNPTFIRWIDPVPGETIESYASRIKEQIKDPNPILIGLSFGGMMAVEVSKQIKTKNVILISSAKTKNEIPFYYRLAGKTNIHKLIPFKFLKRSNSIMNWFFGTGSKEERKLLRQITHDTKPEYTRWAIDKIVKWSNTHVPANIYHIHGTRDKLLPLKQNQYNRAIPEGGHLMILNKAGELTPILKEIIEK